MKRSTTAICCMPLATLALAAGSVLTLSAVAQDPAIQDEVIIRAPAEVIREHGGLGPRGMTRVTMERNVSYADLNLGMVKDLNTLTERIDTAAQEICEELGQLLQMRISSSSGNDQATRQCVRDAVAGTKDQVRAAVDAASRS